MKCQICGEDLPGKAAGCFKHKPPIKINWLSKLLGYLMSYCELN